MGQYTKNATYNGYKRNHKEREKLDFYATPIEEVINILETLNLDFTNKTILEPCCGMGHMLSGIIQYITSKGFKNVTIIAMDFLKREMIELPDNDEITLHTKWNVDFLEEDFSKTSIDFIIMNPPYSTIDLFVGKALTITSNIIMLARTQFVEGEKRFEELLEHIPFSSMYQYVDRIKCYKNGDFSISGSSAQAYSWFIWTIDKTLNPIIKWIRRYDKR